MATTPASPTLYRVCCKGSERVAQRVLEVGQITTDSKDLQPKDSSLVEKEKMVFFFNLMVFIIDGVY
jgi:hypothetical protein